MEGSLPLHLPNLCSLSVVFPLAAGVYCILFLTCLCFYFLQWPGPCKYVPICTPAYTPATSHREEAAPRAAKSPEAMSRLRLLHKEVPVEAPAPQTEAMPEVALPEVASAGMPEAVAAVAGSSNDAKHREEVRRAVAASVERENRRRSPSVSIARVPPVPKVAVAVGLSGGALVAALAASVLAGALLGAAFARRKI